MSESPNLRDSVKRVNEIADGVIHVSKAIKELENGKLTDKAILILVSHATGESQGTVKKVLTGLKELEEMYVKPTKKEGVTK